MLIQYYVNDTYIGHYTGYSYYTTPATTFTSDKCYDTSIASSWSNSVNA